MQKEIHMGLLDALRGGSFAKGVEEWKAAQGGVLLDVRSTGEYAQGHVPGSINVATNNLDRVAQKYPRGTPLFVYCLSGARAGQAASYLKRAGFTNVKNIGGISGYRGEMECQS